ncbi:UNVERIFIED_ORG: hypothetical protein GGE64_006208 [Rhizobium etli]|uniref:hypothetical protein n=1 Tax=Rhizobium TaxID=379 RepID=UPI00098F9289|nr:MULTISPECIES: hypothetical protein [Rhizobium]ARQ58810.1 ricin B lectin domain-containing protein [Rhizobium sp. Kim5]RSC15492.1 hypothetical protein EFR00_06755 [Rhizobium sophoriradicis]
MTSWYFIQTASGTDGVSYGLNVQGAGSAPGTPIITWGWQGGADNELWAIGDDGSVVSALGSGLYLAPSPEGSGLVISATPAYWSFTAQGTIAAEDGSVITAASAEPLQGALVQLSPAEDGPPATQSWWTAPNMQAIQQQFSAWRYIVSNLTDGDGTTFVLNVKGADESPGTDVIVWQLEADSSNSMWQITSDGRILSAMNRSLLLGAAESDGGPVVIQSALSPESGQTWNFGPSGVIGNPDTGLSLGIDGQPDSLQPGTGPLAVIGAAGGSDPPASFQWQLAPDNPLNTIVMQSPQPFPAFLDEEASVYAYIMNALGIADIRSEYANLTISLSDLHTTISTMPCPPELDQTAWNAVVAELGDEITRADSVRQFFDEFRAYQTSLQTSCTDRGLAIGTLAGLEEGSSMSIGGLILSVFEGILYTVLEAVPGGEEAVSTASIIGNVMEGCINVATNAANVSTTISADPFQVAYAKLWDDIGTAFQSTTDAAGLMETIILSDWGKMQAFYAASMATGPNTLSWPSGQTATLVDNSLPGFEISALQMLLPAKFQIYFYYQNDDSPVNGVPSEAQWVTPGGGGTWVKYWIAGQDSWEAYPDSDLMQQHVWGNGVARSDFFQSCNGWGFATSYWEGTHNVVLTICNQTPNVLTVGYEVIDGSGAFLRPSLLPGVSTAPLPPYGSDTLLATSRMYLDAPIWVKDQSGNLIAELVVNRDPNGFQAGDVWISNQATSGGYSLSSPICNSGDIIDKCSGAAQITIFWSGS